MGGFADIRTGGDEYKDYIFPEDVEGEWIRLKTLTDGKLSFILHYTTDRFAQKKQFAELFAGLAEVGTEDEVLAAKLYSNRCNYNMSCYTSVVKEGKTLEKESLNSVNLCLTSLPEL